LVVAALIEAVQVIHHFVGPSGEAWVSEKGPEDVAEVW
jgi:hypothetical protein